MATRQVMTVEEHIQAAWAFLEHSDAEFAAGDELQGSEKLWGAASHAVSAIAKQRGGRGPWSCGKSKHRASVVERLAEEYNDPLLTSGHAVAEKFHANFYHNFMEDDEIARGRPIVHRFVHRIVGLVPTGS